MRLIGGNIINIKNKVIIFLTLLVLIVLAIVIFLNRPVVVAKDLSALVYINGTVSTETTISINGKVRSKLFSEEATYTGDFAIAWYEPSYYEDTIAKLRWIDQDNQYIVFSWNGNSSFLDVEKIVIDQEMEDIVMAFTDGTIIATTENDYLKYQESMLD